jgi:hypothetical protein
MAREGLTDPKLIDIIRTAQTTALADVNTIARKAGRGTGALGLESVGEGLGEYLGELAATGKPDIYDAVLESAAGLSQSAPQALWSVRQANVRPLNTEPPSASVNAPQPSTEPQNPSLNASRQEPLEQAPRNNDLSVLQSQPIEGDALDSRTDVGHADQSQSDQRQTNQSDTADPNLQNRDRSRLASVAQMQSIVRAPDYMRLGPSRTPDSGAPMVFAQGDDLSAIPEQHFGKSDENIYGHASDIVKTKKSEKQGLMTAVEDFLTTDLGQSWEIHKIYKNNNGLTVLKNRNYQK